MAGAPLTGANIAKDLEGECSALESRIGGAEADEARLKDEVKELKARFEKSHDSHDEGTWRDHEHGSTSRELSSETSAIGSIERARS